MKICVLVWFNQLLLDPFELSQYIVSIAASYINSPSSHLYL